MIKGLGLWRILLLVVLALFIGGCDQMFAKPPFNATDHLTHAELDAFLVGMKEATNISEKMFNCIQTEAKRRAEIAGDPETLDPTNLWLPIESWTPLNKTHKRIIFGQRIVGEASTFCTTGREIAGSITK